MKTEYNNTNVLKTGYYSSIFLTFITIVTWCFAMTAVPPAGPYCPANCMEYPFRDILLYYPRDYYWMYLAVFQLMSFLVFIISVHYIAPAEKKIFSFISVAFALVSVTVLLADYFIQFAVVPISVMNGETEGIALITQYNGHGIFIALEELGYVTMSLALFFLAPVFSIVDRLEKTIRWVLFIPFILIVVSFVAYSVKYGIDRSYRFEVAAITINWLSVIVGGILIGIFFKRVIKAQNV